MEKIKIAKELPLLEKHFCIKLKEATYQIKIFIIKKFLLCALFFITFVLLKMRLLYEDR